MRIIIFFLVCILHNTFCVEQGTAIWWNVKPYIFKDNGTYTGIFVDILANINIYCASGMLNMRYNDSRYLLENYSSFLNTLRSDFTTLLTEENETYATQMIPVLSPTITLDKRISKKYAFRVLLTAPGAIVIVRNEQISLTHKLVVGVYRSRILLILALLLSFIIGVIVWLWEKESNSEFERRFPIGVLDGAWWAIVTMTTVGYGDMVPRSLVTRVVSFVWIVTGMVIAATVTATVTDTMSGTDFSSINERKVAVLNESWEQNIAESFNASVIVKTTYEDTVKAVVDQEVYAALINTHVASWLQYDMPEFNSSLSFVYEIKRNIPVRLLRYKPLPGVEEEIQECFKSYKEEIVGETMRMYHRHANLKQIHLPSTYGFFIQGEGLYFLIFAIGLIVIAGVEDVVRFFWKTSSRRDRLFTFRNKAFEMQDIENENMIPALETEVKQLNNSLSEIKTMMFDMNKAISQLGDKEKGNNN